MWKKMENASGKWRFPSGLSLDNSFKHMDPILNINF